VHRNNTAVAAGHHAATPPERGYEFSSQSASHLSLPHQVATLGSGHDSML
jgi:hypothetical protein